MPSFLGPFEDVPTARATELAGGDAKQKVLPLSMQGQQQDQWCWAATAASISAFYNVPPIMTQCQIASQCLGMTCCITPLPPSQTPPWQGDREYALDVALDVIGHLSAPAISGSVPFATVVSEIDAGRPICCHVSWDSDTGHFNAIVGYYDDGNQDVVVRDPLYGGDQILPSASFEGSYQQGGTWDYSYLTK